VTLAAAPPSVLVVDDEPSIHGPLRRFLQQQGYVVSSATDGDEALDLMRRQPVSCLLLDVELPGMSGIELVPRILAIDPDVAILMLTAATDATTATLCMQRGAVDYLTKPVDLDVLGRAIRRALEPGARPRGAPANRLLEREVALRSAELREERGRLERLSVATLEALVNALEAKDPFLRGHSARVADFSAMVAAELGADDEEIERVRTAGRLHDIGKIGIREDILNKQGPLTDDEYEHVKRHVVVGSQILSPLVHLQEIIAYVRGHHERWDGEGYPDALAGTAIPFGARIIGAVEIYDALTTSRPYQEKMDARFAVERLGDLIGTMIDPEVYRALAAVVNRHQVLTFVDEGQGRT
jgi:putative nucleotidyltransferase with HDIG domain